MNVVVTGAAGFIGSHLCEALCASGVQVLGIDCLTDYYDPQEKQRNLGGLAHLPGFSFAEVDLRTGDLRALLDGATVVFHQAGQPGVRMSWGAGFSDYCEHNVKATQRLLEAAKAVATPRFVYASSSSVYGNAASYPTKETDLPHPEQPLRRHQAGRRASLRALRRQLGPADGVAPLLHRVRTAPASRHGHPPAGRLRRHRTAVRTSSATVGRSGTSPSSPTWSAPTSRPASATSPPGTVVNIAGGSHVVMTELIELVEELAGVPVAWERYSTEAGDVQKTGGTTERAHRAPGLGAARLAPGRAGRAARVVPVTKSRRRRCRSYDGSAGLTARRRRRDRDPSRPSCRCSTRWRTALLDAPHAARVRSDGRGGTGLRPVPPAPEPPGPDRGEALGGLEGPDHLRRLVRRGRDPDLRPHAVVLEPLAPRPRTGGGNSRRLQLRLGRPGHSRPPQRDRGLDVSQRQHQAGP